MKGVIAAFVLLILIPLSYSLSLKELISRYSFSAATQQMNVTGHNDFMIDRNGNGISDTLVFELTTNNIAGAFVFVVSLFDKNGILTNETNRTLIAGINKINLTFNSILLGQSQFNYSIKIYNASRKQKYRKDNILTQNYTGYEEGFRVLGSNDSRVGKTLVINLTINSPENKAHVTTLFLKYKNSTIFSKGTKTFTSPTSHIAFNFDNETIKKTHFAGNFTISSVKIGVKTLKAELSTKTYDFRDFAATSYIYNFTDNGTDTNGNGRYDFLEISTSLQILRDGNYTIALGIYDLFDELVEIKNASSYLNIGNTAFPAKINGTSIYNKKLNGPYIIKNAELYEGTVLADKLADAYITGNYNYNEFDDGGLPDITAGISVPDAYRYGIENLTINFTFENIGNRPAFNLEADIFDNRTFARSNKSSLLNANSRMLYQFNFANISDFEITAIADLQNSIEEINESNNVFKAVIKLNKKPVLAAIRNITINETDRIGLNLSASDPNGDNISYSINLSRFSNKSNIFEWNTSVADSGNYILKAVASDGYLNDTLIFWVAILDVPEKDTDNDGIEDGIDSLIGSESSVNASGINLSILLNQSKNLSKSFRHHINVAFMDGSFPLAEFGYNFSMHKLRLHNLTFRKQPANSTGYLLSRGMKMQGSATKTLYVDKINSTDGICVKDEEISSISEISDDCSSANEFRVECDDTSQNSYICTYNLTIGKYKVQGLRHSGIIQIDYRKSSSSPESQSSGAGNSGGGGGGFACIPDWECGEWTECFDGSRNRKCADKSQCPFPAEKPPESEQCAFKESKLVDIVNASAYAGKTIGMIKQNFNKFGISGQAVKSPEKPTLGPFIVFIEALMIVGAYLVVRLKFK
ncbi:hypothetical protein HY487_00285 [Candidatus Woesearchaeota archaeon]|nr:hypothetical protein [Candidatus Woesearchaeota archaeon]